LSVIFAGLFLADQHLEFAGIADLLAVDFGDDVADLAGRLCLRENRVPPASRSAGGIGFVEEFRVVRSDIRDANADVAVADLAVTDQSLDRGLDDLRGNREAHAGERSGRRDEEGVDADQFAARVDQRAAGVAGVDGRVGLDELAGLAADSRVRIRRDSAR
jgi:hypothetical protein